MLLADIEVSAQEQSILKLLAESEKRLVSRYITHVLGENDTHNIDATLSGMVRKRLIIATWELIPRTKIENLRFNQDAGPLCSLSSCFNKLYAKELCRQHYDIKRKGGKQFKASHYGLTRTGLTKAELMGLTTRTILPYWQSPRNNQLLPTGVTR
jgi:hypothetical protein